MYAIVIWYLYHINKIKDEQHILFVDVEKSIWQNATHIHDNKSQEIKNKNILNLIKRVYEKPTIYIKFKSERLNVFPLKFGTKQGCLLSHFYSTL